MYDTFSSDYDRFNNWPARLSVELPFLLQQLRGLETQPGAPVRVLDAACGTGQHAIALAQQGIQAAGVDISAGMVARARENASAAGVQVRFEQAPFGELAQVFGEGSQDAILCLGNSLPHLLTPQVLAFALADFADCLRPGGVLIVQSRNFEPVLSKRERWMEPQSFRDGEREWLFLRFYDFLPDGLLEFNVVDLSREGAGGWSQKTLATRLRPLLKSDLSEVLEIAGFRNISWYGDLAWHPYNAETSGNLVFIAQK